MLTVKQIDAARPKEKSYRLADSAGLFRTGIITLDGETIDGEGLEGIIVLGKVTAEVVSVYEPLRPII